MRAAHDNDMHLDDTQAAPRLTGALFMMIVFVALLALAVPASAADTPVASVEPQAQTAQPKPAEAAPAETSKPAVHKAKAHVAAKAKPAANHVKAAAKKAIRKAKAAGDNAQVGMASYYAKHFNKKKTASGEKFSSSLPTAAHKTLPIGTHVKVTNLQNGQSTTVRVNDRGPYKKGRVIDLSKSAAKDIGMTHDGVAPVKIEVVGHDDKQASPAANNAAVKQEAQKDTSPKDASATQMTPDRTATAPAKPASTEMAEAATPAQPVAVQPAAPVKPVAAEPETKPWQTRSGRRW